MTKVTICGDICPTKDTISLFENQKAEVLFNDLTDELKDSDLLIGNLEFVLSDSPRPIKKSGPILTARTSSIKVLQDANFHLLSLANNHIKDCGEEGVLSSIETCHKAGISTVGAGCNIKNAKTPFIKSLDQVKIGVISFAEQEFNIATNLSYGSSYFDPLEDLDLIREIKKKVDYLIVIYHGGIEHYRYPSPELKKKCRKFVEKGADLVTCQHSHCVGSIEKYNDKLIVYGQGNTVFGYRKNDDAWNEGLIIELNWSSSATSPNLVLKAITACEKGIRKATPTESQTIFDGLKKRSERIKDDDFLQMEWKRFCKEKESLYCSLLLGFNRALIHVNRLTNNRLVKLLFSKSKLRTTHNIIRCESHNEVIQTILYDKS